VSGLSDLDAAAVAERRQRVVASVTGLPDATTEGSRSEQPHLSLFVRKKRFGYLLEDHHGDGRLALQLKAAPGVGPHLVETDPERFHIPAYVGSKGWLGLWLDTPDVDWDEVDELVADAYCLSAPATLVNQVRNR